MLIQTLPSSGTSVAASPVIAGGNATLFFKASLTTADQPPVITEGPTNQVVSAGGTALFTVTATGLDLSYQWLLNGTNIPEATAPTLTIGNVQSNNAGLYTVIVSNVICWDSASAGLGLTWSNNYGGSFDASPAISPDGKTIFIANTSGQFFALDTAAGGVNWSNTLPYDGGTESITSSAVVSSDGSAVYVGSEGGYLNAFNTATGSNFWSTYIGGNIASSPALSRDNSTLYVGNYSSSGSNGLYAVNAATGQIQWCFAPDNGLDTEGGVDSSPAVAQDCSIVFVTQTGDMYRLNSDGSLRWFFPMQTGAWPDSSPAIGADGSIYAGSAGGGSSTYFYGLNSGGVLKWLVDSGDGSPFQSSPAIGADGIVYAASGDGTIWAITNSNGGIKWQLAVTNVYGGSVSFVSSPAIAADNTLYIGTENSSVNGIYAISNGAVQSFWPTANWGSVESSPAIDPIDGSIVVADTAGYVYKLPGSQTSDPNAAWPMFRQNARHAGSVPNPVCSGGGAPVAFPGNPYLFLDPSSEGQSQFSFNVSGTPGIGWVVFASSDLVNWSYAGGLALDDLGQATFYDNNIAGVTNRFYEIESSSGCSQVIGFINMNMPPGTNLIANPLCQIGDQQWPENTASGLQGAFNHDSFDSLPGLSEIINCEGVVDMYMGTGFGWQPTGDNTLIPGQSEFFVNPTDSPITIPFAGLVAAGVVTNVIPPGTNFVSSGIPAAGLLRTELDFKPNDGDQVWLCNGNVYSESTYTGNGNWSSGEPQLAIGQGFILVTKYTNYWAQSLSACQPSFFAVTANPLWTPTGRWVTTNAMVIFNATVTWTGYDGGDWYGPGGEPDQSGDPWLATAVDDSLIAFVGPNPYECNGTNVWGTTFFPQYSSSNGYYPVGAAGVFTNVHGAGYLWFGINDDAGPQKQTNDNLGVLYGNLIITNVP
jgi:outer membrane protein assembly factor BamB